MIYVLVILVVLILVGLPPMGLHDYGWSLSSVLGIVLIILLVLFVMGRL